MTPQRRRWASGCDGVAAPAARVARRAAAAFVASLVVLAAACSSAPPTTTTAASTTGSATPATTEVAPLAPGESRTVTYCFDQTLHITAPPHHHGPAPAVLYLHGGSWIGGDHTSGGFIIDQIGPELSSYGYVVASVNYRLGPDNPWPSQIVDVACAVRYLRAHAAAFDIDPSQIGVWGHSAGAHLASLLGATGASGGFEDGPYLDQPSSVEAVADLAGPSNLVTLEGEGGPDYVRTNFESLLGPLPPEELHQELVAASPVTYVSPDDPPFLVVHATNDTIVPFAQSEELVAKLQASHVPVTFIAVHGGGGHSLEEPNGDPDPHEITNSVVTFFETTL
jgi:acetyl esterase/lipase